MLYDSLRYKNGVSEFAKDHISEETALQIVVNSKSITVTMCSPLNLKDLAIGLLYSENIVKDSSSCKIQINEDKFPIEAMVSVDDKKLEEGYLSNRNFLSVASCGICGKTELDDDCGKIETDFETSFDQIGDFFQKMNNFQKEFEKSGGVHAAAAFSEKGELLSVREDIGRHNAVDKVIGNLLSSNNLKKAKVLLVSGRVSYEIVLKAFRARIPLLAAVSAPSSLAIDYAKEFNITLLGFCRENRGTCYSGAHRMKNIVHD